MRRSWLFLFSLGASGLAHAAHLQGGDYGGADLQLAHGDVLEGVFLNVGNVTIPAQATVYAAAGVPLEIHAATVTIDGTLDATGAGHPGAATIPAGPSALTGNAGQGPGAGGGGLPGPCIHPGGGAGGSHAGAGGGGAYHFSAGASSGNTYGVAGDPYDVPGDMGSGGGSGGTGCNYAGFGGGDGGGSVFIRAQHIFVDGAILADGTDGLDSPGNYDAAGGGGSGGSVVLFATAGVEGIGTISASGGSGGADPGSSYVSCGGGGGGGRVKVYNHLTKYSTLTFAADGGPPGACTPALGASSDPADPGDPGTIDTTECQGIYQDQDADADGIPDACDNCVDVPNVEQVDVDDDGAGSACDCDDEDEFVAPNRPEVCDGADNDCDGTADVDAIDAWEFYADLDGDGRGDGNSPVYACEISPGIALDGEDCDDTRADVGPNAPELCDGVDNDCDGEIDGPYCPVADGDDPDEVRGGCATAPAPIGGLALAVGALALVGRRRRTAGNRCPSN